MRPQDRYDYNRNARALIWRVGTISAVDTTANRMTVQLPDGLLLTNVLILTSVITLTVGARVAVVYDRGHAIALGNPK